MDGLRLKTMAWATLSIRAEITPVTAAEMAVKPVETVKAATVIRAALVLVVMLETAVTLLRFTRAHLLHRLILVPLEAAVAAAVAALFRATKEQAAAVALDFWAKAQAEVEHRTDRLLPVEALGAATVAPITVTTLVEPVERMAAVAAVTTDQVAETPVVLPQAALFVSFIRETLVLSHQPTQETYKWNW